MSALPVDQDPDRWHTEWPPYQWVNLWATDVDAVLDASLGQSMLDYPVTSFVTGTTASSLVLDQLPGIGVLGVLAVRALALPAPIAGGLVVSGAGVAIAA